MFGGGRSELWNSSFFRDRCLSRFLSVHNIMQGSVKCRRLSTMNGNIDCENALKDEFLIVLIYILATKNEVSIGSRCAESKV
jgi:hypothetical protein